MMALTGRDAIVSKDLDRLVFEANAKIRGKAITQSVGLLCHHCVCFLCVKQWSQKTLQCERGHTSTVTRAQFLAETKRLALAQGEVDATRARLSMGNKYPACACGGPLMLPEQASKGRVAGRLFCGSCGVQTGVTQRATSEQIEQARAAAKAEGFEVKS